VTQTETTQETQPSPHCHSTSSTQGSSLRRHGEAHLRVDTLPQIRLATTFGIILQSRGVWRTGAEFPVDKRHIIGRLRSRDDDVVETHVRVGWNDGDPLNHGWELEHAS
jgi:hypothetical protein